MCEGVQEGPQLGPRDAERRKSHDVVFPVWGVHTEKSFRNLIKSNRNQIVLTIFRLIWIQTDVRSVSNQSENGKYNIVSV